MDPAPGHQTVAGGGPEGTPRVETHSAYGPPLHRPRTVRRTAAHLRRPPETS
jgi:hypothetical protein